MNLQRKSARSAIGGGGGMNSFLSNNPAYSQPEPSSRIGRAQTKTWGIRRKGEEDDGLTKPTRTRSRSKTRSRAVAVQKRSVSRSRKKAPRPSDYDSWEFGKVKKSVKPITSSPKNKRAAITVQRWMRGWWARVNFKLNLYRYRLSHKAEITVAALSRVEQEVEKQKELERQKIEEAHERAKQETNKGSKKEQHVEEGKDIIAYLRKENKKLRDKNEKIRQAALGLKSQNGRLEGANSQTDGNMDLLSGHARQIQETHEKLMQVEPKYKESVEQLSNAVEQHRQYCLAEHTIKILYVRLIGKVVDLLEDKSKQLDLNGEVVAFAADMEEKDNEMELPDKLPSGDESTKLQLFLGKDGGDNRDSDSDSEDWDSYSVNQF